MMITDFSTMAQEGTRFQGFDIDGKHAAVKISNSREHLRIMHITDSHVTVEDAENDKKIWNYCKRMHQAYKNTNSHPTRTNISREESFRMLVDIAKNKKVDLILLTGDIVNFPSPKSVQYISDVLEDCGIPYLYVAGNHDWHLEGTEGSDEAKRARNFDVLAPLYQGKNPLYNSTIVKGINIICIDNSAYQITREQLDFFKGEIKKGYPIVLGMHIPVYTSMNSKLTMGDPKWGAAIDTSYELEGRERWSEEGNRPETIEFRDLLMNTPNIIVMAGHVHTYRIEMEKELVQFVTGLSRDGAYRIFDFEGCDSI